MLTGKYLQPISRADPQPVSKESHPSILLLDLSPVFLGLLWWFGGEESACNAGDSGLIPGSGRCPGEGNGNPFQ